MSGEVLFLTLGAVIFNKLRQNRMETQENSQPVEPAITKKIWNKLKRGDHKNVGSQDPEEVVKGLSEKKIADLVLNRQVVDFVDYKNNTNLVYSVLESEVLDQKKEYSDLSTDIIVTQFLSSDKSMYNFLSLVYNTFDQAISQYREASNLPMDSIVFVYKGGNILRIIANDFLRELPRVANREINAYYEQFFKRSDADFSIYVRPDLEDYDEIYHDMILLSYLLQVRIRQEFETNLSKYFDYFKYNHEYQKEILKSYYGKVIKSNALTDINNKDFFGKTFNGIIFGETSYPPDLSFAYKKSYDSNISPIKKDDGKKDNDGKKGGDDGKDEDDQIVIGRINQTQSIMSITANQTMDFKSGKGRTKFTLVRTKVIFNYYFDNKVSKIGGELIDISIPHRLDSKIHHFFEIMPITKYHLNYKDGTESPLVFNSFDLNYLIGDLEYILYEFVTLPWETPKYQKRLNRVFYLYFIDLFVNVKDLIERKRIIDDLSKVFINQISDKQDINHIKKAINSLRIPPSLAVNNLLKKLKFILNQSPDTEDPIFINNFNEMMDILYKNSKILKQAFTNIKDYCSLEGNIDVSVLYDNDFSSLIGSGHQKKIMPTY